MRLIWLFVSVVSAISLPACNHDANLLTTSPADLISFQIVDERSELVWRIESIAGSHRLMRITYGEVPDGFRQTFPEGGVSPRPFADGERMETRSDLVDRIFVHDVSATGPQSLRGGFWESSPKR